MEHYTSRGEFDDVYYTRKRPEDRETLIRRERLDLEPQETRIEPKKVVRAIVREQEEQIDPIKRVPINIIGTLFERLEFVKTRIEELRSSAKLRENIHKDMIKEILEDIAEKEQMESKTVDLDEKRNLKLDISMLRKEKRTENIRYWKDMMELRTELRDLLERLETESKITGIFKGVKGE